MNRMLLNNSTTSAMLQRVSGAAGTTPQCKVLERHVAASSHVVRRWKSLFERSKSYAAATSSASLKRNSEERGHSRSGGVAGFLSTTEKTTTTGSSTSGYYRRFSTTQPVDAAKAETSTMPSKCLQVDNINPNFISMEYAVRGPLVIRAGEIERELKEGVKKPFDQVIRANIGDCHAMGQQPITFVRQLLALTMEPRLLNSPDYPEDVKQRAKLLLEGCQGGSLGSYTDSAGLEVVRRQVAQFIEERDGLPSDWHNIFLTAGATPGIKSIISLMRCKMDGKMPGIMVPIPQYPLYSATIEEYGMARIGYYLQEESNWSLSRSELQRSFDDAKTKCNPRALVVINPGNPTGQVLSRDNIEEIIRFAYDNQLVLLADEVYQANVYDPKSKFYSFKKVMNEMGAPYKEMEMVSFLSASKGFLGECGIRGGYMEILNMCPNVMAMLAKSITASLCGTTAGQVAISALVNPPKQGEPSYELYMKEKTTVLNELKKRAELVYKSLSSFEGFKVNVVQGAMYVFPQIVIPKKAVEAAKAKKMAPDVFYAFELLESTGICIVPGSGFDQKPGTYHFRTTILPQTEQLKLMMNKFQQFHSDFMRKYK